MMNSLHEDLKLSHPQLYAKVPKSRDAAIRAFCLECVGGNINEVKLCTRKECPLYQWRMRTRTLKALRVTENGTLGEQDEDFDG